MNRQNNDEKGNNAGQDANSSSNQGVSASRADVACRSSRAPGSLSTFPDLLNVQNSSNDSNSQGDPVGDTSHPSNPIHIHGYLNGSIDRSSRVTNPADLVPQSRATGAIPKARNLVNRQSINDSVPTTSSSPVPQAGSGRVGDSFSSSAPSAATLNMSSSSTVADNSVNKASHLNSTRPLSQQSRAPDGREASRVSSESSSQVKINQIQGQLSTLVSMIQSTNASIDQMFSRVNQRFDSIESRLSSLGLSAASSDSSPSAVSCPQSDKSSSTVNLHNLLQEQRQVSVTKQMKWPATF